MAQTKFNNLAQRVIKFEALNEDDIDANSTMFIKEIEQTELKEIWTECKKAYEVCVLDLNDQEQLQELEDQYFEAFNEYKRQMSKINMSIADFTAQNVSQIESDSPNPNVRVPPCDTETFYGDYLSWPTFRDMFSAIYIKNSQLSSVERLYYLLQKTGGEAKEIIKNVPLTHNGFLIAWNNLKAQYENSRILINNQLKILFNLEKCNEEKSGPIKKLQRSINNCITTLELYKIDIQNWDAILIYLCSSRLPDLSLSLWEQSIVDKTKIPKWKELDTFLTSRFQTLESMNDLKVSTKRESNNSKDFSVNCDLCNQAHHLRFCSKFLQLTVAERFSFVKKNNICINCLSNTHEFKNCKSKFTCSICKKQHHSLLHRDNNHQNNNAYGKNQGGNISKKISQHTTHHHTIQSTNEVLRPLPNQVLQPTNTFPQSDRVIRPAEKYNQTNEALRPLSNQVSQPANQNNEVLRPLDTNLHVHFSSTTRSVLLGTALIYIKHSGISYRARALIDPGSEASFVSEKIFNILKLPRQPISAQVSGLNGSVSIRPRHYTNFEIGSIYNPDIQINVNALVVPQITGHLPSQPCDIALLEGLPDLQYADENFFKSSKIDILIGGDLYPNILLEGVKNNHIMGCTNLKVQLQN